MLRSPLWGSLSRFPSHDTTWLLTPDTRGQPVTFPNRNSNYYSNHGMSPTFFPTKYLWKEDSLVKSGDNVLMWHINCFMLQIIHHLTLFQKRKRNCEVVSSYQNFLIWLHLSGKMSFPNFRSFHISRIPNDKVSTTKNIFIWVFVDNRFQMRRLHTYLAIKRNCIPGPHCEIWHRCRVY